MPSKHALKSYKTKQEIRAEQLQAVVREMERRKQKAIAEAKAGSGCFLSITIFGLSIPAIGMLALFL